MKHFLHTNRPVPYLSGYSTTHITPGRMKLPERSPVQLPHMPMEIRSLINNTIME